MIDEDRIIEKPKQSMSFIEQLQNQIQLCREAMSDVQISLTPRVETLEALLWAKLKDDKEYLETKKSLFGRYKKIFDNLGSRNPEMAVWQINQATFPYKRARSKELFKAIMVFINKKGIMPIGEQDE